MLLKVKIVRGQHMKKSVVAIFISLMSIATWAVEAPKWEKYSITFPAHGAGTLGVNFSYLGKNYPVPDKGQVVPLEKKKKGTTDIEESFVANVVAQNAAGDRGGILKLWSASERLAIEAMMGSKDAFERNGAFFRNIESTRLISVMRYGTYYLFVVEHEVKGIGPYMKLYAALLEGEAYLMTNGLKGDVFYEKIVPDLLPYVKDSRLGK